MAKKTNASAPEKDRTEDYYQLNTDAIDRLVNASEETAPEIGADQPDPYKPGVLSKLPCWLKALFIKFWFNGAACFFFLWGLGIYISDRWAQLLVLGVALGIITDLLVNNLFRFIESDQKEYDKWMMIPVKDFWTFFVNIVYALVVLMAVAYTYNGINLLIIVIKKLPTDSVPLGVEPILFGMLYLIIDLAFIGIKDSIVAIVKKASRKVVEVPSEEFQSDSEQEDEVAAEPQAEQPAEPVKIVYQQTPSGSKKRKKK